VQLLKKGGRITGVIVRDKEGYKKINASKGVILATAALRTTRN
jgi:hypothetical protein